FVRVVARPPRRAFFVGPPWTTCDDVAGGQSLATGRQHAPSSPTVSIVLRIVFSIVRHCFCAGGFSVAVARPCIVIGAHFPLQIDCILVWSPLPSDNTQPACRARSNARLAVSRPP